MDPKNRRYQKELERIRQLEAINKVLKKGDVENAFLNNADKETEISKDTAVERMLEELQSAKSERKDIEMLDTLVKEEVAGPHTLGRGAPKAKKSGANGTKRKASASKAGTRKKR